MELKDEDVAEYLRGEHTVRDGVLISFAVRNFSTTPSIELIFEMYLEKPTRIVALVLNGVTAFGFNYERHAPYYVETCKCLWTNDGEFYLSLDPYDERAPPSDEDNDFFRSTSVKMIVEEASEASFP